MASIDDRGGKAAVAGDESGPDSGQPAAEIVGFELAPKLLQAPIASRNSCTGDGRQPMGQVRRMTAAHRNPAGKSCERGTAADDVDASAQGLDACLGSGSQPIAQPIDPRTESVLRTDNNL